MKQSKLVDIVDLVIITSSVCSNCVYVIERETLNVCVRVCVFVFDNMCVCLCVSVCVCV